MTTHPTFNAETFSLPIEGTSLHMRPVRLSDAQNFRDRCADPLNVEYLPHLQGKENQSVEDVEAWIKMVQADFNTKSLFLVVEDTETNEVIGEGPLGGVNWDKKEADSGIMLNHQVTGKGIATKALNTSMDFAFTELGIEKIKYGTLQDNKAMTKVLKEKLRAKVEPEEATRRDGLKEWNFCFKREDWLAAMK